MSESDDDRSHFVTAASELTDGDRAVIEVRGRELAVFNVDGEFHAVGSHCPHMGGPCSEGLLSGLFSYGVDGDLKLEREGEIISCPWHGWEFDVLTGEHLGGTKRRLPTYDVELRDGDIYVIV